MLGSDSGESALSAKPKPAERPVSLPTRQRHACDPYLWLRSVVRPYRPSLKFTVTPSRTESRYEGGCELRPTCHGRAAEAAVFIDPPREGSA